MDLNYTYLLVSLYTILLKIFFFVFGYYKLYTVCYENRKILCLIIIYIDTIERDIRYNITSTTYVLLVSS